MKSRCFLRICRDLAAFTGASEWRGGLARRRHIVLKGPQRADANRRLCFSLALRICDSIMHQGGADAARRWTRPQRCLHPRRPCPRSRPPPRPLFAIGESRMTWASESLRTGMAPTRPTPDLGSLEQTTDAAACVVDPRTLSPQSRYILPAGRAGGGAQAGCHLAAQRASSRQRRASQSA